jgi:hypothetical protein
MRKPIADPYVFHRKLLAKEPVEMKVGEYHAGWYKKTLVKGGPWVAVKVTLEQDIDDETGDLLSPPTFKAVCNGVEIPLDEWKFLFLVQNPISEEDYEFMVAKAEWAKKHAPDSPEANPKQKVDFNKIGRLF